MSQEPSSPTMIQQVERCGRVWDELLTEDDHAFHEARECWAQEGFEWMRKSIFHMVFEQKMVLWAHRDKNMAQSAKRFADLCEDERWRGFLAGPDEARWRREAQRHDFAWPLMDMCVNDGLAEPDGKRLAVLLAEELEACKRKIGAWQKEPWFR